jgi:hypothetical protein
MAISIVKHLRGTTAKNNLYTGSEGQITVDTEYKTARVHDGVQIGGFPLAKEEVTEAVISNASAIVALQTRVATAENNIDAAMSGLDIKLSSRVATTVNLVASYANSVLTNTSTLAALVIDGIVLALGDRVLVKNQTTGTQNGLYTVTNIGSASVAWTLTRSTDANSSGAVVKGLYSFVTEGTVNANRGFALITANPITLDSTALVFTQITAAGQVSAGSGLTKTGSSVDVVSGSQARIAVSPDSIDLATTGIIAGTYDRIQVDSYGRAVVGTNPSRAGWTAPTGTASRATFDTATVSTAELAETLKAVIDDLTALGLLKP